MTPRLNIILLILALVIGLPFGWLMIDNRPGDGPTRPVSIEQLRHLANAMPGPHPATARMYRVGYKRAMGDLYVAGSGLKRRQIAALAWVLPVPGKGPIVIDTGMTPAQARDAGLWAFDTGQQGQVDAAMRGADLILATDEQVEHLGGLAALRDPAIYARAALNVWQKPDRSLESRWLPGAQTGSLGGDAPLAVAPGVVVIPAPGHSAGSQMIFVALADGTEILFAGDIAPLASNWRRLRAGSRLMGDILGEEDRESVFAWLRTIRALKVQAPRMVVVPGRDFDYLSNRDFRGVTQMLPVPSQDDDALANGDDF